MTTPAWRGTGRMAPENEKEVYEVIDTIAVRLGIHHEEFVELVRGLAGYDSKGRYDPEKHEAYKRVAYRWMKECGDIDD
jgi:hypothetical protein